MAARATVIDKDAVKIASAQQLWGEASWAPVDPEVHFRVDSDVVVVPAETLESRCNGAAGTILMNIDRGRWRKLVIATTRGAENEKRRPRRTRKPEPFDVEDAGLLTGEHVATLPRLEGNYLI